ncbi:MAG: 23S rRNA (uracil(1939)-C(5))-methyltransferase RlmD [Lachnospiraceae bacterium]|nr:23S rRNA (uracil(1939)-C(5))-methyltransferase RlmD [Lachnospiraceae bacterium]
MKRGEIYEGTVERVDYPNKGIVRVRDEEEQVIVKNVIPGQKVRFVINKSKAGRKEGRLLEVTEKSPSEADRTLCSAFPDCGGCIYQTMSYPDQLEMKAGQIKRLLDSASDHPYEFEGIAKSPDRFGYRNKMEYSFGDDRPGGPLTLGLHRKASTYDVLTCTDCVIVHPDFNVIVDAVLRCFAENPLPYFHKIRHEGYLRHLLLRRSASYGDILVHIVTTGDKEYEKQFDEEAFRDMILELEKSGRLSGHISGIMHIINDSLADIVRSDETRILFGKDYFMEKVLGLDFKVSSFSFFQTNTRGAEVLYDTARNYIGDTRDKNVFDLYSGTGTIAQILAPACRKVTGVEIVEETVESARYNAKLNGLTNCDFIAGDVLKVLDDLTDKPDFIVLDPPRDGIHPKALPKIIDYKVDNIVYISCKATSLARDLKVLQEGGYRLVRAKCIDLFPDSQHVETVVLLRGEKVDSYVSIDLDVKELDRKKVKR